MSWQNKFSDRMITRGSAYFKDGRVSDYSVEGNTIKATVFGSRPYRVHIVDPGKPDMKCRCTCPYALDGNRCKHEAAVLFKWDEKKTIKEQKNILTSDPFPRAPKGKEPYYHMADIASNLTVSSKTFTEASQMIASRSVRMGEWQEFYGFFDYEARSADSPVAIIAGEYRTPNGHRETMEVRFRRKKIEEYRCSCGKHYNGFFYSNPPNIETCSHILALLMIIDRYTKKFDPGDNTDRYGNRFLDAFDKEKIRNAGPDEEKTGNVELEPKIVESDLGFEVNFKIGNGGKMYIVKNLTDLYDNVTNGKEMVLGKNATIDFRKESFNTSSRKLYSLIEREVMRSRALEQKMESRRTYYYSGSLEAGKGLSMVGDVMDTIYDIAGNMKIEFKGSNRNDPKYLTVVDHEPVTDLYLEVKKDKRSPGRLDHISVKGTVPSVIEGVKSRYYISEGCLGKISEDVWSMIIPFTESSGKNTNEFSFKIGDKKATAFCYNVLPVLRESNVFRIHEKGSTEGLIPDEAEFSFYLDSRGGEILCETYVTYGETREKLVPYTEDDLPLPGHRDINQEVPVFDKLAEIFEFYTDNAEAFVISDDEDLKYEFLKTGVDRLLALGEVNSTDAFSKLKIRRTPMIQLGVSVESDLLNLEVATKDMSYEELADLLMSYRIKKRYHKLRNGEFVDLENNESMEMLMSIMESMGVSVKEFTKGKIHIPAYRALYLDKMLEGHEELVADRDRTYRRLIRDFKAISEADQDVPLSLQGILRPYQDYGFKWLSTLETAGFGGILADDMGLGKTLEIISLLLSDKEKGKLGTALVVCPASLVYNWIEEINRFAPELTSIAVAGTKSVRRNIITRYENYDIMVTSYDLLKRDVDLYEGKEFTHEILDEAQFIKNARAISARSVKSIRSKHRFALTGTPIENRLSELWSIFDFLMPGFLYNYEQFRKTYELPISHKDQQATDRLKYMVSPFLLRRKKQDVLKDLPDKIEELHYARLGDEQQKLYDGQIVRLKGLIESESEDFNQSKIQILAELTRIRQICCDPNLLFSDYKGGSAKREACMDLIRSAIDGGHKILLFSQFTSMLELLEKDISEEGIGYYVITGATPKEERLRLVKRFNSDDTPLFLISLKAGGTGLNLTGADIVIHYDPWWNVAAQDQATDRAHRIGQTKEVTVYKLIAKDTIEEKIVKLQDSKKELADAVLGGESRSIGSMSREELLELLE